MSDAIKKLHDYLAKSPSVVYPEDVLAYLPAIEAENDQLREQGERLFDKTLELGTENAKLRELVRHLYEYRQLYFKTGIYPTDHGVTEKRMHELGVEP